MWSFGLILGTGMVGGFFKVESLNGGGHFECNKDGAWYSINGLGVRVRWIQRSEGGEVSGRESMSPLANVMDLRKLSAVLWMALVPGI